LTRFSDWQTRLRDGILARRAEAFSWGRFDCCLAACDLVEKMTGVDPAKKLRGYSTATGAFKKLAQAAPGARKSKRLEAVAARLAVELGAPEVPPTYAQRGDMVLARAETPGGMTDVLAVVDLTGRYAILPSLERGWALVPMERARRAWRVG
jgi:hypothetical protein